MSARGDTRKFLRECRDAGVVIEKGRGDHHVLKWEGRVVGVVGVGKSFDPRAMLNVRAQLRRAGVVLPSDRKRS